MLVDRGREVLGLGAGVGVRGVEGRGRGLVTLEAGHELGHGGGGGGGVGLVLAAVLVLGTRRGEREADVSLDLMKKVIFSTGILMLLVRFSVAMLKIEE